MISKVFLLIVQACVDFVAKVVGVTSGPKGRILVLHIKLHPKIVKDTESVLNR